MLENRLKGYEEAGKILVAILALNWLVAIVKIISALRIQSSSMAADGFHSLSDGASNIIGLIGVHFASKAKDRDHPYGHKKYETFFALGIAFLLFLVAIGIIHESLGRFANPILPKVGPFSFMVMFVTMAINFAVMRYESKKGKELESDILTSDSLHTRADILTSLSVILTFVAIKSGFPIIDQVTSILISCLIAYSGYRITRHSCAILCDTAAIFEVKQISDVVLGVKGVKACHKIRTRGRPDDIHVDLHVQVDKDTHIDVAHKISYAIEEAIKKSLPCVTDVIVHMEPKE